MIQINGNKIADKIKDEIVAEILLKNNNDINATNRPHLAIVLVGERPDSSLYVSLKEREAKRVGIDTSLYKFPEDAVQDDIAATIKFLNSDELTDGILLQLPLPAGLNTDELVLLMNPEKDVDRFHPENLKKFIENGADELLPPVAQVVIEIFEDLEYGPEGRSACVIANSEIFGLALAKALETKGALTRVVSPEDDDLKEVAAKADILISAVGKPGLITEEYVKDGALIIDIGITKDGTKVSGDVNFESVKNKAGYVTPVPGGVGPITIATALRNTLEIWKKKNK